MVLSSELGDPIPLYTTQVGGKQIMQRPKLQMKLNNLSFSQKEKKEYNDSKLWEQQSGKVVFSSGVKVRVKKCISLSVCVLLACQPLSGLCSVSSCPIKVKVTTRNGV